MRKGLVLALTLPVLAGGGVLACGGDDDDAGDGEIRAAEVRENLTSAGYRLDELTLNGIPGGLTAGVADEDAGLEKAFAVSGKGLEPPVPDFADTVTVLVFDSSADAEEAWDENGGDSSARELEGNRIYTYGGTGTGESAPELEQVIDASKGS